MNDKGMKRAIIERIELLPEESVFCVKDFSDLADADLIRHVLKQLADQGTIDRIGWGIYSKPRWSVFLGKFLPPDLNAFAHAVARSRGWTIAPSGALSANLLGVDTQVPGLYEYVSDGPYANYEIGGTTIRFRHSANKDVSRMSETTLLVVNALKALGKDELMSGALDMISSRLDDDQKQALLEETRWSTSWIREACKTIALQEVADEGNCKTVRT